MKPLTPEERKKLIETVVDGEVDTVTQMALADIDSLRNYVRAVLGYELGMELERAGDQALEDLYYGRRGETFRDEEDSEG